MENGAKEAFALVLERHFSIIPSKIALTKWALSGVPNLRQRRIASAIATLGGRASSNRISNNPKRKIVLSTREIDQNYIR